MTGVSIVLHTCSKRDEYSDAAHVRVCNKTISCYVIVINIVCFVLFCFVLHTGSKRDEYSVAAAAFWSATIEAERARSARRNKNSGLLHMN